MKSFLTLIAAAIFSITLGSTASASTIGPPFTIGPLSIGQTWRIDFQQPDYFVEFFTLSDLDPGEGLTITFFHVENPVRGTPATTFSCIFPGALECGFRHPVTVFGSDFTAPGKFAEWNGDTGLGPYGDDLVSRVLLSNIFGNFSLSIISYSNLGGGLTSTLVPVPLPPALFMLGSALAGLGFLGWKTKSSGPSPRL